MPNFLFSMPIKQGKTETWKGYIKELTGSRYEEFKKSNHRAGIRSGEIWLQRRPYGDTMVVRWDTDEPMRAVMQIVESKDPFDKWFVEKVLIECLGVDLTQPPPPINEKYVDYQEEKTGAREYSESRKM